MITIYTKLVDLLSFHITGSATTLLCGLDPSVQSAVYYADCQIESAMTHPRVHDPELMNRLWTVSEELVSGEKQNVVVGI